MASPVPKPDISPDAAQPAQFDRLVQRVLAGDATAWTSFVARVHPAVLALCENRRLIGGIGDAEDAAHDVALRTLDRMRASDFAALRSFIDAKSRHPTASFVRWLAVVVGNTYVDYLRSQPEYQRKRNESSRRLRRLPREELDADASAGEPVDPLTVVQIRRIVDCVASDLFPQQQRVAIAMWLRGNNADEIATELGLDGADQARKLLHAARQRLRRAVHGGSK